MNDETTLQQLLQQLQNQSEQFNQLQQQVASLHSQIEQQSPELVSQQRTQNNEFYAAMGMRAPKVREIESTDSDGPQLAANSFRDGRYSLLPEQLALLPEDRYANCRLGSSALSKSKNQYRKPVGGFTTASSIDPWIRNISEEVRKFDTILQKTESNIRDTLRISLPIDALLSNAIELLQAEEAPSLEIIKELLSAAKSANRHQIEITQHNAAEVMFQRRKAIGDQQKWSSAIKESANKTPNLNPEYLFGNEEFKNLVKDEEDSKDKKSIRHLAYNSSAAQKPFQPSFRGGFSPRGSFRGRGGFSSGLGQPQRGNFGRGNFQSYSNPPFSQNQQQSFFRPTQNTSTFQGQPPSYNPKN